MSFLSPIWFFALAALSIPILIHLWNIRPGKTLKVGSISLITEASKTTSRSLKLLDILLLILRCLLLALLAFFLAGPLWSYFSPDKKAKGWVLIPKENFNESYQKFKPQVDSLMKAGYEFHYFNKGFAKQDWQKLLADTGLKDTTVQSNYWALVKALDSKVRNSAGVYIITPNSAIYFKGEKPQTNLNLSWKTYTPADSTSRWIAAAWISNNGEIKVTLGGSAPSGTMFANETMQADGNSDVTVNVQNGQPKVSLKNTDQPSVAVDTATLSIAIYTDKYAVDASYLKAALQAATAFTGEKASVKQYSSPGQIRAGQTWLFWLSDAPVDSRLLASTANVFRYESGKIIDTHTIISPGNISLTKRVHADPYADAVWQDGFGKALLNREQRGAANIYHFYTHFNPAWSDLVWNDNFPKQILRLLNGKSYTVSAEYDRRVLSHTQLMPNNIVNSFTPSSIAAANPKDISPYFWLMLMAVFFAERWLSHKTKPTTNG
ncbi:BatA domain-containing protein [Mucilaginibacter sp. ZT4R22]|uniref:BatA domain-containing protein n=1 Tax=Mucilaginibacter pankratovii TaxID=2772110 RepID=A0ABR7WVF9_9SPHI|nr:BatA domain-containing protein [Mucilaginibacter pankratovii]MBD1366284.1 BatA domain-containing protein [Mucilaginibacter pankratovii]